MKLCGIDLVFSLLHGAPSQNEKRNHNRSIVISPNSLHFFVLLFFINFSLTFYKYEWFILEHNNRKAGIFLSFLDECPNNTLEVHILVEKNKENPDSVSRRSFLRNAGLTVGGLVVGGSIGSLFPRNKNDG